MSILKGKHTIKEIDGVRCSVVEKKASQERVNFLTDLLKDNGFEVKILEEKKKEEEDPQTYLLGVTDLVFNAVIWVYQRKLRTLEGKKVTADYWNQKTQNLEPNYWDNKLKD
ncbi:MAG TPA: hypothetical protein QF851_03885 [Flavobacteriales bacterium]|nr:hypothetical protein [Flavobacteriales bacterium]